MLSQAINSDGTKKGNWNYVNDVLSQENKAAVAKLFPECG